MATEYSGFPSLFLGFLLKKYFTKLLFPNTIT